MHAFNNTYPLWSTYVRSFGAISQQFPLETASWVKMLRECAMRTWIPAFAGMTGK